MWGLVYIQCRDRLVDKLAPRLLKNTLATSSLFFNWFNTMIPKLEHVCRPRLATSLVKRFSLFSLLLPVHLHDMISLDFAVVEFIGCHGYVSVSVAGGRRQRPGGEHDGLPRPVPVRPHYQGENPRSGRVRRRLSRYS